jgi:uncharacterized protein YbjT (DUF2867 family)
MILVIGGTGTVGSRVVDGLLAHGSAVRVIARDPATADLPEGVEVASGDLADPQSLVGCLDDVEAAFLVWPFLSADGASETVRVLAERVPRVVYLSAEAAARRPDSSWARVEGAIESAAEEWVFLRPTGFAANTRVWSDQIRGSDVVRWVYGQAARSLIHEDDIAAVAVPALTEAGHDRARYVLSGPAAVTQADQVSAIGDALGRTLRWEEIAPSQLKGELDGVPDTALETWASFVQSPEIVTTTVHDVTG